MMQNNLIMCYIYSEVSTYWRHPGYWKAFDEQRFCVISCLILEHIFHFQFRNRAYCAKWTHFSFSFFHCCFKYSYTFRTLKNNAIRMQHACCSVPPFSVTVTSSENGMVVLFACGQCASAHVPYRTCESNSLLRWKFRGLSEHCPQLSCCVDNNNKTRKHSNLDANGEKS